MQNHRLATFDRLPTDTQLLILQFICDVDSTKDINSFALVNRDCLHLTQQPQCWPTRSTFRSRRSYVCYAKLEYEKRRSQRRRARVAELFKDIPLWYSAYLLYFLVVLFCISIASNLINVYTIYTLLLLDLPYMALGLASGVVYGLYKHDRSRFKPGVDTAVALYIVLHPLLTHFRLHRMFISQSTSFTDLDGIIVLFVVIPFVFAAATVPTALWDGAPTFNVLEIAKAYPILYFVLRSSGLISRNGWLICSPVLIVLVMRGIQYSRMYDRSICRNCIILVCIYTALLMERLNWLFLYPIPLYICYRICRKPLKRYPF